MLDLMESLETGAKAARERDRAKFQGASQEVRFGIGTISMFNEEIHFSRILELTGSAYAVACFLSKES